jgi:SAM-dependent methyltransferase
MAVGTGDAGAAAAAGYALALDPREVARYRMMAEQARATEAEQWRLAGIGPGARVADVGCGPGALLPVLAAEVAPGGTVTGVDADPAAVALARSFTSDIDGVSVREGAADRTGLPAGAFDVVMVRHVLAHNGGREQAIVTHLAGLLRPGGCLYLADAYGAGMATVPELPVLTEMTERYTAFHAARGNSLQAGLHLARWLRDAGLDVVDFRGRYQIVTAPPGLRPPAWAARDAMLAAGIVGAADLQRWERAMEDVDAGADRPTLFFPLFTAVGRASDQARPSVT